MRRTLKTLSMLLTYPSAELQAAVPEMRAALEADGVLSRAELDRLDSILNEIGAGDLYDIQERYVLLFDRTRSLSLHLFEHVHGESRDRGQAMVDLAQLYEKHGLALGTSELPDFIPLFLEFLSAIPEADARQTLADTVHIHVALRQRLEKRGSNYAGVFAALEDLSAGKPDAEVLNAILAGPDDDPNDLAALDAAWMEEEVKFGPGADASCGTDGIASKIRAGRRPAPGVVVSGPQRPVVTHTPSTRA
jgi:nitrate reductase delta subunit